VAVILLTLVVLSSCKHSTESGESYKDPREMTWTCDTLLFLDEGQTWLNNFLVFDASNIFAYGHSSRFWRYNGSKWNNYQRSNEVGAIQPYKMIGFTPDHVFCFGEATITESKIIHFNGFTWTIYTQAETVPARLLTACASNTNNIYAGGDNGWMLYYNGVVWQKDQIKRYTSPNGAYMLRGSAVYKDTTYFIGYNTDNYGKDVYYFIKGKYKNWRIIDSTVYDISHYQTKWGTWDLYVSPDNKLYSYGPKGVWEYSNNTWNQKLYTENAVRGMFALNSNYIVTAGVLNEIQFYDGVNWTKLPKFMNDSEIIHYKSIWSDGKEMFIMGNTMGAFPQKTIIWHGK
jgi:hypothetical protein